MEGTELTGAALSAREVPSYSAAGAIVRAARRHAGLTLVEVGRRCGYSASQISRFERGVQPLTDVTLLRRFAAALDIPPVLFGLAPANVYETERHAGSKEYDAQTAGPIVSRDLAWEDGDDPVRRRELLAAAGLAGTGALERRATQSVAVPRVGVDEVLYGQADVPAVPMGTLRTSVTHARCDFQMAQYDRLAAALPGLLAAAIATSQAVNSGGRASASTLLAEAYIVAANFMVKVNNDVLALTLSDRALQAARRGDDALTMADAQRAVATVLRRTGHRAVARDLLISSAHEIEPGGRVSSAQLAVYGTLLEVAAYTAAVDGDRRAAHELIGQAKTTAIRLGQDGNHRFTAFGPANVTLYQVSIAQVLGDSGTAIEYAKTIRPAAIPTVERRGRYWVDVARAYHQWNKPELCYRALLAAEQAAPAEVRYRPPVHRITEDLLRGARQPVPGLHAFARRIGLPT